MRIPILLLTLALAGCQTTSVAVNVKFPPVPKDIAACLKQQGVEVPQRDLTVAEVEALWKRDRLTIKAIKACLSELVVRDQRLAKR